MEVAEKIVEGSTELSFAPKMSKMYRETSFCG